MIRAVGERRKAQVRSHFHDVVILDARHGLPPVSKSGRIEMGGDGVKANGGILTKGCCLDGAADRAAQSIMLDDIEASATGGNRRHDGLPGLWIISDFARPKFRILQ